MKQIELIAKLAKRNEELKELVKGDQEIARDIITRLTAIGAPLNDNLLDFNKEQREYLKGVLFSVEQILDIDRFLDE